MIGMERNGRRCLALPFLTTQGTKAVELEAIAQDPIAGGMIYLTNRKVK